jgi:hypothetical protein
MIASTEAGIIIGTESWLNSNINSSEVFPPHFKSYRHDCQDGSQGGGVFLLLSDTYTSDEPAELNPPGEYEVVWCKIKVKGDRDLYVGAFYKPPFKTAPEYLDMLTSAFSGYPGVRTYGWAVTLTLQT